MCFIDLLFKWNTSKQLKTHFLDPNVMHKFRQKEWNSQYKKILAFNHSCRWTAAVQLIVSRINCENIFVKMSSFYRELFR